jgi:O-antigen/teichoic acid export membrane protein
VKQGAGKMVHGVVWGMGGAAGQALFQLVVFVALARTLSPTAFGVVAIATALIDLLNFVGRGGITEVLVQRRELDDRTMNAGFMASLICGSVLTLALFLLAPLLARMFDTPALEDVILFLAPLCVLYAAGAVYEGILRHNFLFKQLALRNTTATVASGLIALALALNGMGVYALIAQRLVSSLWSLVAMIIATRWLPSRAFDWRDMIAQLRQGSSIALSSVLGAGNQRIVDLVVGYFLGPTQLGFLRVAWRMLDLLNEVVVRPIGNVSLSSLPKAKHAGRSVEEEYLILLRFASVFVMPVYLGFAAIAPEAVGLIFGEKWMVSAHLLSVLCFVGLFLPLTNFKNSVLIAHGAFRSALYLNVLEFILSVACVLVFAPFGLTSAAIGNVVRAALAMPLSFAYLQITSRVSALRSLRAGIPAAISALFMLLTTYVLSRALPSTLPPLLHLAVFVCGGVLAYCAAILAIDRKLLTDAMRITARK